MKFPLIWIILFEIFCQTTKLCSKSEATLFSSPLLVHFYSQLSPSSPPFVSSSCQFLSPLQPSPTSKISSNPYNPDLHLSLFLHLLSYSPSFLFQPKTASVSDGFKRVANRFEHALSRVITWELICEDHERNTQQIHFRWFYYCNIALWSNRNILIQNS